eukprot:10153149-Lingulodinium_polyedra.AAC.1
MQAGQAGKVRFRGPHRRSCSRSTLISSELIEEGAAGQWATQCTSGAARDAPQKPRATAMP